MGKEEGTDKQKLRANINIVSHIVLNSCFNLHDHTYLQMCILSLNLGNVKEFIQLAVLTLLLEKSDMSSRLRHNS